MPRLDLRALLAPHEPREFFDRYWEKQPLAITRGDATYFQGLLSRADLERVLSPEQLRAPLVDLVERREARVPRPVEAEGPRATSLEDVYAGYRRGATVKWYGLDRRWAPLSALCRAVEAEVMCDIGTETYLTPRDSQGFDRHYDRYDFMALQIEGRKHWRVYDAPVPLPRAGAKDVHGTDPGAVTLEVTLSPGDMIYLPRGFLHEAWTTDAPSLSVSLGFQPYTYYDVLQNALEDAARRDVRFRRSLPLSTARPEGMAALDLEVAEMLRLFADIARPRMAVGRLVERFVTHAHPPDGGFLDPLAPPDPKATLDTATLVARRPGLLCTVIDEDDAAVIVRPGHRVACPLHTAEALRAIAASDGPFAIGMLPDVLADAAKVVLVRRLIEEGFLVRLSQK
jgi:ribosomal protein L16 Arg81 hydroxylase